MQNETVRSKYPTTTELNSH